MTRMQTRLIRVAAVAATAILGTAAQAGAQAPRAMPADYTARYAASIEPGDYGMPRAMPGDYAVYFAGEGSSVSSDGFDWADAGIGAGATASIVLAALAAAAALRSGGRLERA